MTGKKLLGGFMATASFLGVTLAQEHPQEDLILCDCGIGDNNEQPGWSTSRQVNWYRDINWPESAYEYPEAPNQVVEVPFNDGIYPWTPGGVTATLPNDDVWTVYIEDGTPDGFNAGTAVTTKEGGQALNCWAYRGRPVSAAINQTVSEDAICWTAFVCNRDDKPPRRPDDMVNPTSTADSSSVPPATTVFSTEPGTATAEPTTTDGEPEPTEGAQTGGLSLEAVVNPRFLNWPDTWEAFINNFVWDQTTGQCVGDAVRGDGYNISFGCAGIQIDDDSHMTVLMIQALRDVGLNSLWFNQNPTIPPGTGRGNSTSWVVLPEAFTLTATDTATSNMVGYVTYATKYDGFLAGQCSTCEAARFNEFFFNPIISAMQGSYPTYNSFTVQGQCEPWMVCK